ncbi:MAG: 3-hydroxybutyryl-CoA dehydrogenase [Dehalococcoidia bacterium]|nr:MAG: 3-hydroxybutyryl-CoA dehydrogenase [Dehalococcoidia bacterium]
MKKVGVVGCGTMGSGITQVCAQSGYQVVVSEINDELLNKGLAAINSVLTKSVDKGKISQQDKDTTLDRIKGTTNTKDFYDCDLIIEAAIENMELKKKIFAELDKICPKHAILATNTSCLSIIDMAMATSRPDKVLGLHFMNPAPIMKLLEIVKTIATSDETLEVSQRFGKSLGKTIVIGQDTPGFIVNRLMMPFLLNAIRMLDAGVATREDIDTAINLGLNHPIGPLALADLIGIDVVLFVANAIYEELKDPQYAPPVLLNKMVTAGWLGRKTGKGFYEYK